MTLNDSLTLKRISKYRVCTNWFNIKTVHLAHTVYSVIQEERSLFMQALLSAIVRKSLYEHVYNSERLPR